MSRVFSFSVSTKQQSNMIDITSGIKKLVRKSGVMNGLCVIFIPHTTAAITINENSDSNVVRDMLMELNKMVPLQDGYKHMEGNSAAHIKTSMMGSSETIIIEDGRLVLGTWQGIYLMEFDGPRERKVQVKIIDG